MCIIGAKGPRRADLYYVMNALSSDLLLSFANR